MSAGVQRFAQAKYAYMVALAAFLLVTALSCGTAQAAGGAPAYAVPTQAHVHDFEIDEYRRDTGLAPEKAERNLEIQAQGAGIVGALEDNLGDSYAGVWFDPDSAEFVVPFSPGAGGLSEAGSRSVIAREAARASIGASYRALHVRSTWEELEAAQAQLNRGLEDLANEELARTSLDPRVNAVVVHLASGAAAVDRATVKRLAAQSPVNVVTREEEPERFRATLTACHAGLRICDPPLRGGVGIGENYPYGSADECTAGFRAKGKTDGKWYLLTAGHCVVNLPDVNSPIPHWLSEDTDFNSRYIGELKQRNFPNHDWAKIEVSSAFWKTTPFPAQIALWGENQKTTVNPSYPIKSEGSSYINQFVCHSGITSGTTCGVVLHVDKDGSKFALDEEEEVIVTINDLIVVDGGCNIPGDSGGPLFAWFTALGMDTGHEEGYPPCDSRSLFTRITDATNDLGVTINPVTDAPEAGTAGGATFPTPHQASVGGLVDPNSVATNYHFEYGTTAGYGSSSPLYSAGAGAEPIGVSGTLNNLKGSTTYHFRIKAENSLGSEAGEDRTFTTPAWPPIITPGSATDVKAGHGTLNAQVNPQGSATAYRFEWGKASEGFPNKVPVPDASVGSGTSNVPVSEEITGLKGLTEYHWRVVASSEEGTTTSATQEFTTPDWRPVVTTEKQTKVEVLEEEGRATLHGKVNPKGFATSYRFEWGTQAEFEEGEYNNAIPVPDGEAGSGEADVSVEATIKPIKGQTTYHFRLVAENAEGKTTAGDKSFTTPDWRPQLGATDAIGVEREEATLVARINPKGFKTTYRFEWGSEEEFKEGEYNNLIPIPDKEIGSGLDYVEVSEELEGLERLSTYHVRAVAENAEGTRVSSDHVFATSASAFRAEGYPATFEGVPTVPIDLFEIHLNDQFTLCEGEAPTFQAEAESVTEMLATTAMQMPACKFHNYDDPLQMNGCGIELDPDAKAEEAGHFEGEVSIGPPGCGPITLSVGTCPISIPAQTRRGATFENKGEGSERKIEVDLHAYNIRYEVESGGLCYASSEADGLITGTWDLTAEDEEEQPLGTWIDPSYKVPPEISDVTAEVGATTATLRGTIDTGELYSWYGFQYGTTTGYGSSVAGAIPVDEEAPVEVEKTIEGLEPDTTYHYMLGAVNAGGGVTSEDHTFTTNGRPRFVAEDYPATIAGEGDAEGAFTVLAMGENWVVCESSEWSGEASTVTTALQLDASFGDCHSSLDEESGSSTVSMNSCRYEVGLDNVGPPYAGPPAVVCDEEGDAIEIDVSGLVTFLISAQSAGGDVGYENKGEGSERYLHAEFAAEGLAYSCEGFFCFAFENKGSGEDGTASGGVSLEGRDEASEQIAVYITTEDVFRFEVVGEESAEESEQPRFEAFEYPATIAGEGDAEGAFTVLAMGENWVVCESSEWSGEASTVTTALQLDASFGDCHSSLDEESGSSTVSMNSCRYEVGLDNVGPPYTGSPAVVCGEEGDAIEIEVSGLATFSIAAQNPGGAVGYENKGEGSERYVHAELAAEGLAYSCEGFFCFAFENEGSGEDGTMVGGMSLRQTH